MRAPEFWQHPSWIGTALAPAAWLYEAASRRAAARARPVKAPVPVLCVGNIVAGGAGKTPLALALAARLRRRGATPHIVTRGYRGSLRGPVRVDPARHDFRAVGDEPLLLAAAAPTWVARSRAAGAAAAAEAGASLVLLDDGMQHHHIVKDMTIVAVDGGFGFGNGRLLPAGPLREPIETGLARAVLAVVIGEDRRDAAGLLAGRVPVVHARLQPRDPPEFWRGRKLVAFAGIGRPMKFFETLEGLGGEIAAHFAFPDHHPYHEGEIVALLARTAALEATAITTEKDWVRLPAEFRPLVQTLPVDLVWQSEADEAAIDALLDRLGTA